MCVHLCVLRSRMCVVRLTFENLYLRQVLACVCVRVCAVYFCACGVSDFRDFSIWYGGVCLCVGVCGGLVCVWCV